jgi:hypothetical protein
MRSQPASLRRAPALGRPLMHCYCRQRSRENTFRYFPTKEVVVLWDGSTLTLRCRSPNSCSTSTRS